jgi:hypothetical protein
METIMYQEITCIQFSIYPTDAQLDCSKNVKIYMKGAPGKKNKITCNLQPIIY